MWLPRRISKDFDRRPDLFLPLFYELLAQKLFVLFDLWFVTSLLYYKQSHGFLFWRSPMVLRRYTIRVQTKLCPHLEGLVTL